MTTSFLLSCLRPPCRPMLSPCPIQLTNWLLALTTLLLIGWINRRLLIGWIFRRLLLIGWLVGARFLEAERKLTERPLIPWWPRRTLSLKEDQLPVATHVLGMEKVIDTAIPRATVTPIVYSQSQNRKFLFHSILKQQYSKNIYHFNTRQLIYYKNCTIK